ncbi:MAG: RNA polymerase subunit sigma-70, partial [Prevotella pleuritidis]|nr:RNA polymerase subunit sigma-70 [Hoylesella pleuritidis]
LMHISAPLQWSVSTGLGLQYNFTPTIGIFIEPNLNYYFRNGSGIYTPFNVQRTNLTIPFGIRIKY